MRMTPREKTFPGTNLSTALPGFSDFSRSQDPNLTRSSPGKEISFWEQNNICEYLDNVTDTQSMITCRIDLFLPPVLFVVGIVSNIFVILVMRSKYFRSLSTSLYMVASAVADFSSVLVALPAHYIFVNFPHVFDAARDAHPMCSFFQVFGWGTSDLGVYFTVAMTTERAIAISYPLKAYKLCTVRRAKFVVLGLVIFEFIKVSHLIFKSRVVANTTRSLCDIDRNDATYAHFYDSIYVWIHVTIMLVSYAFVMAGNFVIIRNIRRSTLGELTAGEGRKSLRRDSHVANKNRQLSIMLLIDSFSLVICTLPYAIVTVLMGQFGLIPDSQGGKNLTFTLTFYLLYINRCLNFFLYCISGSRFRSALKSIFGIPVPSSGHPNSTSRSNRSPVKRQAENHDASDASRPSETTRVHASEMMTSENNCVVSNYDNVSDRNSVTRVMAKKTNVEHASHHRALSTDTYHPPGLPNDVKCKRDNPNISTIEMAAVSASVPKISPAVDHASTSAGTRADAPAITGTAFILSATPKAAETPNAETAGGQRRKRSLLPNFIMAKIGGSKKQSFSLPNGNDLKSKTPPLNGSSNSGIACISSTFNS